jgi:hypothetical protein
LRESEWLSIHSRSWRSATPNDKGLGEVVGVGKGKEGVARSSMVEGMAVVAGGVAAGGVGLVGGVVE